MFAEKLTDFMDLQTGFSESVTVGGVSGVAIFDVPTNDILGIVANTDPVLYVVGADFLAAAVDQSAVVRGVTYTVTGVYPDGTGITKLILK